MKMKMQPKIRKQSHPESNKRILIVDDDIICIITLKSLLSKLGFNTTDIVKNGFEALSKINDYDIIMLDLKMPGITGIDVLNKLSEKNKAKVIVISSDSEININEQIKDFRVKGVIEKPLDTDKIVAKFRTMKIL